MAPGPSSVTGQMARCPFASVGPVLIECHPLASLYRQGYCGENMGAVDHPENLCGVVN